MSNRTELGLGVLVAALALGVLGDELLRTTPWGLNVLVWTASLALAVAVLVRWRRLAIPGERRALIVPLLFFAGAFAWRDSLTLQCLNALALLATLALAALRTRTGHLRTGDIADHMLGFLMLWGHATAGLLPLLLGDIQWKQVARGRWVETMAAAARGLLIAVPLLLVFGGLFTAADAVFEGIVIDAFDWDVDALVLHVLVTGYCAWMVGGLLRAMLLAKEWHDPTRGHPVGVSLGIVEIGVALGLLNALFLAFVFVQARYFFGGTPVVMATPELTFADYARRGFFELATVSALALPMLLFLHWLLRKEKPAHERLFRALAGVLVALLFIIMASAVQRMRLYQQTFGMTELRLYTTAFMGWLAVLFVWFVATVLRGRRERFAFGALVSGFLAIALLNGLNPDALIARTNARHDYTARSFDAAYLTGLSADAVPALVTALPQMPEAKRPIVAAELLSRWSRPVSRDWRTWNHGRAQASQAVRTHEVALRRASAPQP